MTYANAMPQARGVHLLRNWTVELWHCFFCVSVLSLWRRPVCTHAYYFLPPPPSPSNRLFKKSSCAYMTNCSIKLGTETLQDHGEGIFAFSCFIKWSYSLYEFYGAVSDVWGWSWLTKFLVSLAVQKDLPRTKDFQKAKTYVRPIQRVTFEVLERSTEQFLICASPVCENLFFLISTLWLRWNSAAVLFTICSLHSSTR